MKIFRSVLALLIFSCSAATWAQFQDGDGAVGGICRPGEWNCQPGFPPGGGGGDGRPPVDPSPYDPIPGIPNGPGHGGFPGQPPGEPGFPGNPGFPGEDYREVYLGQYYRDQSLNLMQLLHLDSAWNQRIESVQVMVRSGDQPAYLTLIADGSIEDQQTTWGSWVNLEPRRDLIIGETVRRLRLDIRGKLWIDRIVVRLSGGYFPPQPPPVGNEVVAPGYVNQDFYQTGNVDIQSVAGLYQYRGYRITSVTVYGRGIQFQGQGQARLLGNGMVLGYYTFGNGNSGQTIRIQQNLVVGENLNGLNLLVDPRTRIERVEVRLTRYN